MADDTGQEKEYDPSPEKLRKSRAEGKVAQSKDVISAAQLLMAMLAFGMLGGPLFDQVIVATGWTIEQAAGNPIGDTPTLSAVTAHMLRTIGPSLIMFCILMLIAVLSAGFAQTGFLWAPMSMVPKPEKMNPITKLGQLLNPKKLSMNLLLAFGKLLAAGLVIGFLLYDKMPVVASLALAPLAVTEMVVRQQIWTLLIATATVLTIMAALDYLWQRRQYNEEIKMTRDEYKRDMEEQEGKPIFKSRRRQMHRDLTMNRIIEAVPQADVIVTNPTHFAVALRYRPSSDRAPLVTAKGVDSLALHIRTIARRHGVPIVENRPLAQTLWRKVKVGKAVPANLFQAVAEILARVYRKRPTHRVPNPGAS